MVVQCSVQWCMMVQCAMVRVAGAVRCKCRCNIMAGWRVAGCNALVMHNLTSSYRLGQASYPGEGHQLALSAGSGVSAASVA